MHLYADIYIAQDCVALELYAALVRNAKQVRPPPQYYMPPSSPMSPSPTPYHIHRQGIFLTAAFGLNRLIAAAMLRHDPELAGPPRCLLRRGWVRVHAWLHAQQRVQFRARV